MNQAKIYTILLSASFLGFLASCDDVKIEDRYEPVERPNVSKVMLIQEFTGDLCVNCPKGAAAIHTIQEAFPGQVIAVGLHPEGGGPNTEPIGDQDFRCEEAQVMYEFYKPSGFPCAVFNGQSQSTRFALWYSDVYDIFSQMEQDGVTAKMTIAAETIYEPANRKLKVDYTIEPTEDITQQMSVLVWIMENNIIGSQRDGNEIVHDYVHNHVLRASLNGGWGETLPSEMNEAQLYSGSAEMTLDEKWVADNCQVVVYVFQTDTRYVEQATVVDVAVY